MILPRPACARRLPLLVAGAGLLLVLGGCGSDAADITDNTTSSATPTQETTQTSTPPEPTDPAETTESTDTPSGDSIDGDGYTYAIPEGWEDISDDPASAQADSAVRVSDPSATLATNVNVLVRPSGGVTDIESLRDQFKKDVEDEIGTRVQELANITIAGETAIGQTASTDQQGGLVFTQYFTAHEDGIYAVTLTAPQDQADAGASALDSILASWKWE